MLPALAVSAKGRLRAPKVERLNVLTLVEKLSLTGLVGLRAFNLKRNRKDI